MGDLYEQIDDGLATWIRDQHLFFVATAPLAQDGHVNCSPKGGDTLRILDPSTVVYQDLTGSGAETIAHLRENGRIVMMFCAFKGPTKIVRLYGQGDVLLPGHPDYGSLIKHFPKNPGARSFIRVRVTRISDSCGYAVPFFEFKKDRDTLEKWVEAKGPDGLEQYRKDHNERSIDGLPAIDV